MGGGGGGVGSLSKARAKVGKSIVKVTGYSLLINYS